MLTRALEWWRRQRLVGLFGFLLPGVFLAGWHIAASLGQTPETAATTTLHRTATVTRQHVVTVRVRGHVVSHHDHVLVVYVPRIIVRTPSGTRKVVPPHIVRVVRRPATPTSPQTALVAGVGPPPETVTVPVTITVPETVPGPTSTVTATTVQTVTQPASTVTVTITIPGGDTGD